MPAADFHNYRARLDAAIRRADPDASAAQREAGNARVGRFHAHGLRLSVEYPKGSTRRGKSADGKEWSRTVSNHYGYIRGTEAEDGEYIDVWLGAHPESQLVFVVDFLTADGEHDEVKAVCGVRNYAEAKKVITDNYPDGFWESRVGECRGMFMTEFKKFLRTSGIFKKGPKHKKALDSGWVSGLVTLAPQ